MAEISLLSDLCTICHSPPKYRCPRCSARTCSLACSTRHKQWAQCSGVRNPAAYLKRHELATPKNFDQDYNFISGIERGIETAERSVAARGVQLRETRPASKRDGPMKGEVNLRQALEKSGVTIEKAPAGMKRSLQNKTSWNKNQRCLSWTVEWITADNTTSIGTCSETQTLPEAFAKHIGEAPPTKKRKLSKKNKEQHADAASVSKSAMPNPPPPHLPPATKTAPPVPSPTTSPPTTPTAPHPVPTAPPTHRPHPQAFYLHIPKPPTPSPHPTLLPLAPSQPLSALLRTRLVREFPTIYVLASPPAELPPERYTLQRDGPGEAAAALLGVLDGGAGTDEREEVDVESGAGGAEREREEGDDATAGQGRDGDGRGGGGEDHDGAEGSTVGGAALPLHGTEQKAVDVDTSSGALATGSDELAWILREVM